MARSEQLKKARQDLLAALTIEPDLFPAFDTLLDVLGRIGRLNEIEKYLKKHIADERFTGYCWGRLAEIHAQRGDFEPALAAGLKALPMRGNQNGAATFRPQGH